MGKQLPKKVSSCLSKFLRVLNKPQVRHFLVYLSGLIWLIKFHSTREIAGNFAKALPDNLQRFLNGTVKKTVRLWEAVRKTVVLMANRSEEVIVVIDDTICARKGQKIEGGGHHYSGSGIVKGQCAVTCVLKSGTQWLCWAILGYRTKMSCPKGEFKSKVELALEILFSLRRRIRAHVTVLMDSWYTCAPILIPIIKEGWTFVAAVKKNRIVKIGGRETNVSHLAKGSRIYKTVRLSKKRKFRVAKQIVHLPKVGSVLLLITKNPGSQTRFLFTNDLGISEARAVGLYNQRFGIEVFHKDIKQHLAFGHMFMRSWQGVQTHWTLVAIAYNLITLSSPGQCKGFRKKIRHFRASVSIKDLLRTQQS